MLRHYATRFRLFRHEAMPRPWQPFGAHALSAVCVVAGSVASGILLLLPELIGSLIIAGDGSPARADWAIWLDEIAVHLLVMWVAFLYQLVVFFPLYLMALRWSIGGALTSALMSACIFGVWGLTLVDPAWPGILLGLFFGGIYGLAFHPLAKWFRGDEGNAQE